MAEEFALLPVRGLDKVRTLAAATYRPSFLDAMNEGGRHIGRLGELARHTRVAIVRRPRSGFQVEQLADLLNGDFAR
jgi:hypothetical protein